MAVTYGFFNSVGGDRKYNADDISGYFVKLISDGVFATPASAMQVQENSGMTVQVSAGYGFVKCRWIKNDAPYLLTLDAADLIVDRVDRVVMRLDIPNRLMELAIKKGTTEAPALTRVDGGVWELSLAQIAVAAGATSITQADITDERADTSVCGYVTGLIDQIDTTNLFAQYNAAFNTWFANVQETVKSTTIVMDYHSRFITTVSTTAVPVNITAFNSALDVINVYVNGMRLAAGIDYTYTSTTVTLAEALTVAGTVVDIEILKSIDMQGVETIMQYLAALEGRVQAIETRLGGLSFCKLTKAEYDALTTKDANTVYYVVDSSKITQYLGSVEVAGGTIQITRFTALQSGTTGSISGLPTYD